MLGRGCAWPLLDDERIIKFDDLVRKRTISVFPLRIPQKQAMSVVPPSHCSITDGFLQTSIGVEDDRLVKKILRYVTVDDFIVPGRYTRFSKRAKFNISDGASLSFNDLSNSTGIVLAAHRAKYHRRGNRRVLTCLKLETLMDVLICVDRSSRRFD